MGRSATHTGLAMLLVLVARVSAQQTSTGGENAYIWMGILRTAQAILYMSSMDACIFCAHRT
jgi:hypothetical protein